MKRHVLISICIYLFSFLVNSPYLVAQEKNDSLYSVILKEKRFLQVYLPDNYSTDKKYDVLYLLDGEMLSRFVAPIALFSEENELMPQVIIIGIKNNYWYDTNLNSRDRDFLPKKVDGSPLSGGADNFIQFLKEELIPYIQAKYSTTENKILFGHSYGGMFTIYTFLTNPQIFNSYIASDPALWWNEGYVLKLAERNIQSLSHETKTLFVGGRNGGIYEAFGIKDLESLLTKKAPGNLRWETVSNVDEHHGSVRLKNIYDGLKFTYFGYSSFMVDFFPMSGILLKDKPVPILLYSTYLNINPGIRYTTDGSDPDVKSPRFDYGTMVSAPSIFTLKQFSNFGPDKIMKGTFILGDRFAPLINLTGIDSGGFHYEYYELNLSNNPIGKGSKPLLQGILNNNFNLNNFTTKSPFTCLIEGFLKCGTEGYYTFFIEADTLAKFYIDNKLLMTVDLSMDKLSGKSFVLPLAKGFHQIRIEYFHNDGNRNLSITYLPPVSSDIDKLARLPINIPFYLQYRKKNE
jgi:predicted alpha/beta superfamily hydrolase